MNKIEKRGKVRIINEQVVEKEEKNQGDLYNYLLARDFSNFIPLNERRENTSYYPYKEDFSLNQNQKAIDIIDVTALLHNKTSYNKEVNHDKFKEIYEDMIGYTNYLKEHYYAMLKKIEYVDFPSPSELLYITNYAKIQEALDFVKRETEAWYNLVKEKNKQRISLNHGNLSLDHAIVNEKTYLISWEKNVFDSPIVDIIAYYRNTWQEIEFSSVLERYFERCKLTEEEKKLLFINLVLPPEMKSSKDEYENTVEVRKLFDYIYKTENLIRPYYTEENKKENSNFN